MKLEQQVASMVFSMQLKDLGYPQEGLFWWKYLENNGVGEWRVVNHKPVDYGEYYYCAAPTVAELIDLVFYDKHEIRIYRNAGGYHIQDFFTGYDNHIETFNMAEHWATLIIWLAENKYINFKESV